MVGIDVKRAVSRISYWWADLPVRRWGAGVRARTEARLVPSAFWYGRYAHTFVERRPPADLGGDTVLPRLIWVCWTGPNPMSSARQRGLERIRALNPEIRIELVTPDNVTDFVVDGHPLHPAYGLLSYTHRADYLRAYLLHHHGGGYSDIKPMKRPWGPHFDEVERRGAWLMGPALPSPYEAGTNRGKLGKHLKRYYRRLMSGAALIARSHTPLTAEWLREVERVMSYSAPALEESARDSEGEPKPPVYPLEWMDLLGNILQPLLLKHSEHVIVDPAGWWDPRVVYR